MTAGHRATLGARSPLASAARVSSLAHSHIAETRRRSTGIGRAAPAMVWQAGHSGDALQRPTIAPQPSQRMSAAYAT
jgi:hypothetical protein